MNKLKLYNVGIDTKSGIARFNNNEALYEKWLYDFVEDQNYAKMLLAIQNQNVKEAFGYAHTLKGILGNLSINKVYEDICPLVEQLREGNLSNIDLFLNKLKNDYDLVICALKNKKSDLEVKEDRE